jgi:hypothetical protein
MNTNINVMEQAGEPPVSQFDNIPTLESLQPPPSLLYPRKEDIIANSIMAFPIATLKERLNILLSNDYQEGLLCELDTWYIKHGESKQHRNPEMNEQLKIQIYNQERKMGREFTKQEIRLRYKELHDFAISLKDKIAATQMAIEILSKVQ